MPSPGAPIVRCSWADSDELMRAYHDEEWGVPVHDSRALWEKLMLDGFQAGLAWITVLRKRDAFREAFAGFEPERVARFGEAEIAELLGNAGIIRSRAKIEATIDGVHVPTKTALSERISKELKSRGFKFVGPTIVYAWMQAVGIVNDHATDCFRRAAV
jgi:DNA-3-methyladenine glycosylase I